MALTEEKQHMRMPFMNKNEKSYGSNSFSGRENPFAGSTEMDIRTLTERVLDDDRNVGYVTSEGQVMPRNTAFENGYKDGIELVKQRVWGGENSGGRDVFEEECQAERFDGDEESVDDIDDPVDDYDDDGVEVIFSDEAKRCIAAEALKADGVETGGALIGAWERGMDGRLIVHVARATGPGPNATQRPGLFSPNLNYYRRRVGYYREINRWDYLGEWHKHPGTYDSLSSVDISTARSLIREEGWPLLLLPVVNVADGHVLLENNVILSPQLGGRTLTHAETLELEEPPVLETMDVYIDSRTVEDFRAGDEDQLVVSGVCNDGESYVFIPFPGLKNAQLRLVKSERGDIPVSARRHMITAVVGNETIRCYHVCEGEIAELEKVKLLDTGASVYERNAGLLETTALKDKTLTIVGCGSLGSTMALSLARAGVGQFKLFDFDRLSPANIARHQAGLNDLGRNKAHAVADLIRRVDPSISVAVCTLDVVNSVEGYEAFREAAADSDVLVCTTDTDDSRMLVNNVAVELGKKAVQAGLHERASSGIVHVYDPENGHACFACHRARLLSESSKRAEGVAYSEAKDVRDLTIQPGLAAQINLVAETGALRTIDALMGRHSLPDLTLVYVDAASEDAENDKNVADRQLKLRVCHLDLERVPDCHVCGSREDEPEGSGEANDAENVPAEEVMKKCKI